MADDVPECEGFFRHHIVVGSVFVFGVHVHALVEYYEVCVGELETYYLD